MNEGASFAKNKILFFLHADVVPPVSFVDDINKSLLNNDAGWFGYKFDITKGLMKLNEKVTRKKGIFSGGGDQGIFIKSDVFKSIGTFNEKYCIMEDFDLTRRLKKSIYKYDVVQKDCIVSARKYKANSWLRVNFANLVAFTMFSFNIESKRIKSTYHFILNKY
jgi:hypothetical protein